MHFFEDDSVQLYNLKDDLGEKNDLAKAHPERASALLKELKAWRLETKAVIPEATNPDFAPDKAVGRTGKKKRKKNDQ